VEGVRERVAWLHGLHKLHGYMSYMVTLGKGVMRIACSVLRGEKN
jgi:hypothetical protein